MVAALVALAVATAAPSAASAALHTTNAWKHGILNGCCIGISWSPVYEDRCKNESPPWKYGYCSPVSSTQDEWHLGLGHPSSWGTAGVYHRYDNGIWERVLHVRSGVGQSPLPEGCLDCW